MLNLSEPIVQGGLFFTFLVFIFVIVFIVNKIKSIQVQNLQKKIQDQADKIDTLNTKLIEAQDKLFHQGSPTKSTSFTYEQTRKIEDLEEEVLKHKTRVKEARAIAQEASMVKYDFLANIRHEVRTPMNSILVFADLLRGEIKDKTQLSYANNIFKSGHKLLELMDKIIELSHLESGSFTLEEKAVDTNVLFESILEKQKKKAYKKALELKLIMDENLPHSLILDDEKVNEILTNLIDNAIKFTKQGYIKISVKVDDANVVNNTINISISVEDTGMGIDPQNQKKIFEIFEKRENCNEIEFQGTGLGLSINRKMARHMKGDVRVESELGKGSTFTLLLRNIEIVLSNDANLDESQIDFSSIEAAKIMVVDEAQESGRTVYDSFKGTSVEVLSYNNSRDAIEALKRHTMDLIFIDVDLLKIDEGAVSKVMAKISQAPAISLTDKRVKDINFISNGLRVIGHMKKPISKLELFKTCLKVLNSSHLMSKDKKNSIDTFKDVDNVKAKEFLNELEYEVTALYTRAHTTNDLNASKEFATALGLLAKKHQIQQLVVFSNDLIKKIELFDIEAIQRLMDNYLELISSLKNKD